MMMMISGVSATGEISFNISSLECELKSHSYCFDIYHFALLTFNIYYSIIILATSNGKILE